MSEEKYSTDLVPVTTKGVTIYEPKTQDLVDTPGTSMWAIPIAGRLALTEHEKKILFSPVDEDDVEIRPDGLIYLPWMEYAKRLRDAFGLQWSLVEAESPRVHEGLILWKFYLIIRGCYAGTAIGEQQYNPKNKTTSWGDACEGAKSNALMRLCKGIGVSLELWQPQFIRSWLAEYAEFETVIDGAYKKKVWKKKATDKDIEEIVVSGAPIPMEYNGKEDDKAEKKVVKPKKDKDVIDGEIVEDAVTTENVIEAFEGTILDENDTDTKKMQMTKFITACQKQRQIFEDCGALATYDKLAAENKCTDLTKIKDRDIQKKFYLEISKMAEVVEAAWKETEGK